MELANTKDMTDVNLLPEEFRRREEKERASRERGKRQKIELSEPLVSKKEKKSEGGFLFLRRNFLDEIKGIVKSIFSRFKKRAAAKKFTIKIPEDKRTKKELEKKVEQERKVSSDEYIGETPEKGGEENFWQKIFQDERERKFKSESAPARVSGEATREKVEAPQVKLEPRKFDKELVKEDKEFPKMKTPPPHLLSRIKQALSNSSKKKKPISEFSVEQTKKDKGQKSVEKEMDVNLMPLEISLASQFKEKITLLLLANVACLIIISLICLVFLIYSPQTMAEVELLNQQIALIEKQVSGLEGVQQDYNELQSKIELAKNLLANHVYWTQFFTLLENHTVPEVAYISFTGDLGGKIYLGAVAINYYDVARQMLVFQKADDFVSLVDINAASRASKESEAKMPLTEFNISLEVKPEVFKEKK